MTPFIVQDVVDKQIAAERQQKEQNGWYSSGLGSCLTTRYLERSKVAPDEEFDARTLRVFSVGNIFEDWLTELIKKQEGVKTEEQMRITWPEYELSGRADQVFSEPYPLVYEYKTMHSRGFWYMQKEGTQGKINHRMQLWTYLERLGIEEGRLVYFSKDDLTIAEYVVLKEDAELRAMVVDELMILNAAWKEQLPPPPMKLSNGEWIPQTKEDWQSKYSRWAKQIFKQPKYLNLSALSLNYPVKL